MDDNQDLNEKVLDLTQRQKRAMILRAHKSKIERARELAKGRMAPEKNIKKRAYAQARQIVRKRFAGARGAEYEKLGPSEKIAIDRAIEKKQALIKKIALRLIPRVKQAEQQRLHSFMKGKPLSNTGAPEGRSPVSEELNSMFEQMVGDIQGSPKTDKQKVDAREKKSKSPIIQYAKFGEESDNVSAVYQAVAKKAGKSGIDIDVLGEVYDRGMDAWTEETGVSQQQYAFARVNSFINQGKTYFNEDSDLHEARAPGKAYVAPFNDEQGKQRGWKSSDKWGKVKYWQPHAKKSALKHAGLQEEEVSHTNENFIDGKGPGKPGDSARHGLKGKSASELKKIRSSETASPRKKQLAHWMLNMHHNEETDISELSATTINAYRRGMEKQVAMDPDMDPQKRERRLKGFKTSTNKVLGVAKVSVKEDLKDPKDNPCWDGYKPVGTKKKAGKVVPNCVPEAVEESYNVNDKHYKALTDLDLNTKNRDMTTKNDGYGPLNPMDVEGSKSFWEDKAKMWNTSTAAAMEARCRNCAAFNQAPAIMKKMAEGLGPAGEKIQGLANLGFCELFEFKCAGDRTCNKWLVNGPITEEDTGNGAQLVDKESKNSKIRKKMENVDRAKPHGELTKQTEIIRKVVEDHTNCGTPECCGECDTAVTEKLGNSQNDPKKRLQGTDSLVKAYKTDTPCATNSMNESLNESFNIAYAAGVGVTLTASDLGMKTQGAFALHPSVVEEMKRRAAEQEAEQEVEEEVRSSDIKGVVVHTASGKTVVRRQKVDRKIIGTGNLTDGKPDDTV